MIEHNGWLNIYKPTNISSFGVIKKIKKKFNLKKIGHAGTLDPLAEGVLPIAIGKTTKLIQFINKEVKEYEFEIKWGEQTSTDDREGEVIDRSDYIPSELEIKRALDFFLGEIIQLPPKASAVKINGERAYSLFRKNKEFKTKEKVVTIYQSSIIKSEKNNISKIKIKCGKGFYVRSFARDLGIFLKTKGHVYSLKRTNVGKFNEKNAILLDDLLKIRQTLSEFKGIQSSVLMLDDILAYEIEDEKVMKELSYGKSVEIDNHQFFDLPLNSSTDRIIFLKNKKNILAYGKFSGNLFKPIKVLI